MNTQRLTLLADFLDTIAPEKFSAVNWRHNVIDNDVKRLTNAHLLDELTLTTGDAIGWACAIPEFIAAGLEWDGVRPTCKSDVTDYYHTRWYAVAYFFDISYDMAEGLFGDCGKTITANDIAQAIRDVVADRAVA